MSTPSGRIRVLIADDSPVVRRLVERVLGRDERIEVVGTVANGALVLQGAVARDYDVLVLDLEMPDFDGLATLRALKELNSELPVLVFTGADPEGVRRGLAAYRRGAVEVLAKPDDISRGIDSLREALPALVKELADRRAARRAASPPGGAAPGASAPAHPLSTTALTARSQVWPAPAGEPARGAVASIASALRHTELLVIGSSTGGPNALAQVLAALPGDLRVPVLIVQHMPEGFTAQLAARLDRDCALHVAEAKGGEVLTAGHVLIAPGGRHMEVVAKGPTLMTHLTDGPLENSCRPAVDPMFRTAVRAVGGNLLAVVLTGMGQDGMEGARAVRAAGGRVLAQDQATSVVWGMPGAVVKADLADEVLPLSQIPIAILADVDRGRRPRTAPGKGAA
ncbi:MAG: chemotaxis-specific protein-glutamate methyltransferase CheB [Planctomycetota bacterium]